MGQIVSCKRRKIASRRFEVSLDVHIVVLNRAETAEDGIGVVRNLSLRGACIETHARLAADDQVTLYLTLPDRPEELEIKTVVVRWARNGQMGVEFVKLERSTSQHLMLYLASIHGATRSKSDAKDSGTPMGQAYPVQ